MLGPDQHAFRRVVHNGSVFRVRRKALMNSRRRFEGDPMLLVKPCVTRSHVHRNIFEQFHSAAIDSLPDITAANVSDLSQLGLEFGFSSLVNSITEWWSQPPSVDNGKESVQEQLVEQQRATGGLSTEFSRLDCDHPVAVGELGNLCEELSRFRGLVGELWNELASEKDAQLEARFHIIESAQYRFGIWFFGERSAHWRKGRDISRKSETNSALCQYIRFKHLIRKPKSAKQRDQHFRSVRQNHIIRVAYSGRALGHEQVLHSAAARGAGTEQSGQGICRGCLSLLFCRSLPSAK
jgi:hypothetical protein